MDELVLLEQIHDLENIEIQAEDRNILNLNPLDPFEELSDHCFMQIFRLSKHLCRFLIHILEPFMRAKLRNTDLSISTRVLTALRFFASGSYQMDIGINSYLGVSQASVSRSVKEVTDALNRPEIFNHWVKFPTNFEELNKTRLRFFQRYNFPGVIGCIDCTHIAIFPPNIDHPLYPEHLYVNRKGYHSINVQLIADSDMKIINVNARYPGSTNDAFIWQNSNVQVLMRNLHTADHQDYFLLGDSGYPLRSWLLTPFDQEPAPGTPEHRYNSAHKSTRSLIERVNGLLKMRFRCCLKHRVLHYAPEVACKIINACVVLHNLCVEHNNPEPDDDVHLDELDLNDGDNNHLEDGLGRVNEELGAGRALRRTIVNRYFV